MREIPLFRLRAEPASPDAERLAGFKWAGPEVGQRHQIGGQADWLQGDETPICASCGEPMTFYGQLDSIGDEVCLADAGLVYVFVCFNDFEVRAILQSG